jgi:hypothetical protein
MMSEKGGQKAASGGCLYMPLPAPPSAAARVVARVIVLGVEIHPLVGPPEVLAVGVREAGHLLSA